MNPNINFKHKVQLESFLSIQKIHKQGQIDQQYRNSMINFNTFWIQKFYFSKDKIA